MTLLPPVLSLQVVYLFLLLGLAPSTHVDDLLLQSLNGANQWTVVCSSALKSFGRLDKR